MRILLIDRDWGYIKKLSADGGAGVRLAYIFFLYLKYQMKT